MSNDNILGLFEVTFNGLERGLEVKQYGQKDEVEINKPLDPAEALEMDVTTVDETMEVPGLTVELLNRIHANASVRVTESELVRRKAIEAYRQQQALEGEDR